MRVLLWEVTYKGLGPYRYIWNFRLRSRIKQAATVPPHVDGRPNKIVAIKEFRRLTGADFRTAAKYVNIVLGIKTKRTKTGRIVPEEPRYDKVFHEGIKGFD